jgi:hypothetical protein
MAAWGYGLLGPVEVRVDGHAVPLPGARQRLVLAVLLVDVNRMVPADRLIDELWETWYRKAIASPLHPRRVPRRVLVLLLAQLGRPLVCEGVMLLLQPD